MNELKDMDCGGRAQRRRRFGLREGSLVLVERSAGLTPKRRRASFAAAVQKVTNNFGMHGSLTGHQLEACQLRFVPRSSIHSV